MKEFLRFVAASTIFLFAATSFALRHPKLLDSEEGCELWLGSASGNDPSVRLSARLCPSGQAVRGQIQWSSLQSGWNVREVAGTWSNDALTLRDVRLVEEKPNEGWRFCTVDRYALQRVGPKRLAGKYTSAACDDVAEVTLERISEAAIAARPVPKEAPKDEPPPEAEAPLEEKRTSSGCAGCSVGATGSGWWLCLLATLVLMRRERMLR